MWRAITRRRVPRYWSDLWCEHRRRVIARHTAQTLLTLENIDMSRTFTVAEAESLLPVLESLLRSAIQAKTLIEEVDAEQQNVALPASL